MEVKEKILTYLKSQMAKTSLSERTLESIAQSFSSFFSDENALTDEVMTKILSHAKSVEGQYSHDLSKGLETLKEQLAKQQPPKTTEPQQPDKSIPQEIQAKLDAFDAFMKAQEKKDALAAASVAKEKLKQDVQQALKAKGCEDSVFLKLALTELNPEEDLQTNVEKLKAFYDKEYSDAVEKGAFVPRRGGVDTGAITEEERDKATKDAVNELREKHLI